MYHPIVLICYDCPAMKMYHYTISVYSIMIHLHCLYLFIIKISVYIYVSISKMEFFCVCSILKSCPTLWDPVDCSLPGPSAHGIFQARILEWVAISSSRGSSQPRDRTLVSCIGRWFLYCWAIRKAQGGLVFALGNALENSLALSSSLWGPFWAMEPLPGGSSGEVPKPLARWSLQ